MSKCGCKDDALLNTDEKQSSIFGRILYYMIAVVVLTILIPVLWVVGMIMLFKSIVLNKSTEIMPSLRYFSSLLNKKKDNDEEEDYLDTDEEDINPDDYELVGVSPVSK